MKNSQVKSKPHLELMSSSQYSIVLQHKAKVITIVSCICSKVVVNGLDIEVRREY